ncbi:MAG: hypothetical protein JWN04_514 [Myxococcaceae bacterium]|nr:hypothetical protein [Myxococcaceae bacterium]
MCMDSRSGPELPLKVHGFRETVKLLTRKIRALCAMSDLRARARHLLAVCSLVIAASCSADAKTVEGALALAASAVGARDHDALFQALDERARYSLASVYQARTLAAKVIRESYPPEARASALAELGDAVNAHSSVELFRARCGDRCLDAIASSLGAPGDVKLEGRVAVVKNVRGTEARLYRADDGRYGLVWETAALMRERTRAAAELDLIQKNGVLYRSQRALRDADR